MMMINIETNVKYEMTEILFTKILMIVVGVVGAFLTLIEKLWSIRGLIRTINLFLINLKWQKKALFLSSYTLIKHVRHIPLWIKIIVMFFHISIFTSIYFLFLRLFQSVHLNGIYEYIFVAISIAVIVILTYQALELCLWTTLKILKWIRGSHTEKRVAVIGFVLVVISIFMGAFIE